MVLDFPEKKKETIILLAIVFFILSLIAWFFFDTLRLTAKIENPQTAVQTEKKTAPQSSTGVVHKKIVRKKIDAPKTGQESPSETSTALQPEEKTASSDADTVASAPADQDEIKSVNESSKTDPKNEQKDETVAVTTTDKPADAPSSDASTPIDASDDKMTDPPDADDTQKDKSSEPQDDAVAQDTAAIPEKDSAFTKTPDKTPEKVAASTDANKNLKEADEEKPSPEDEVIEVHEASLTPDVSELTVSSYQMRQPLHPYSIKLSSNRSKSSAQNGVKVLKNDKIDPYVVQMDLGAERGIWWNVFTGHFKTKQDALNMLKTLDMPDARIKKMPYANLIDEFSSEEKMATVYQHLEQQGYDPYVIRDDSKWRLFVGDFLYAEGAAQRSQKQLEDAGFTSRIVKR